MVKWRRNHYASILRLPQCKYQPLMLSENTNAVLAIFCGSRCNYCLGMVDANAVKEYVAGKEYNGDSKKEIYKRGNY